MESNPYQAPRTVVADIATPGSLELAGRWMRLLAVFIDGLIMMALYLPIMFGTGYMERAAANSVGIGEMLMYALGGFLVFILVQGWPLAKSGQTWGKKLLGMRIAQLDGSQPSLGTILFKRYLPVQVVSAVPVIGAIAGIVNVLFIFREDRRCVHDLIAGTQVVKV